MVYFNKYYWSIPNKSSDNRNTDKQNPYDIKLFHTHLVLKIKEKRTICCCRMIPKITIGFHWIVGYYPSFTSINIGIIWAILCVIAKKWNENALIFRIIEIVHEQYLPNIVNRLSVHWISWFRHNNSEWVKGQYFVYWSSNIKAIKLTKATQKKPTSKSLKWNRKQRPAKRIRKWENIATTTTTSTAG